MEEEYNWCNKTILIAEDEDANFSLLEEILEETNVNILRAVDGQEAIDLCKSNQNIDLVLMDIKMPKLNGIETTKKIKQKLKNLPIIAQTAFAMANEKEEILKAGCDDYIPKPLDYNSFLKKINDYINLRNKDK